MNLSHIKEIALKYAEAISTILDIDVIIIDNNYNRVASTSRHTSGTTPVSRFSVIGEVLHTGKVMVLKDKIECSHCQTCADVSECIVSGLVSVPVFFDNRVVGAIALLVPKNRSTTIFENTETAVDFLESMADLLSSKLKNIEDYNKLNVIKKERETIINTIEDGLVAFNDEEKIIYYYNQFMNFFKIYREIDGCKLGEVVDHPVIKEMFMVPHDISYRSFYYEEKNYSFFGLISKRTIAFNGTKYGTLLIFNNINEILSLVRRVLDDKSNVSFADIQGEDLKLTTEIARAKQLAVTDENILISGEPGFDSSTLARAIHNFSDRSTGNFETVDCDNISFNQLEVDLFGSERETIDRKLNIGKLRLAKHGTIFFKNINEMPLYLQRRLLEVIKTKQIVYGPYKDFNLDVRMIFHSSCDLMSLVIQGCFDEELYYRIYKNAVTIPPLAKRKNDIKVIIDDTISQLKVKYLKPYLAFDEEILKVLYDYNWPNNIHEIEKTIGTIIAKSKGTTVTVSDLEELGFVTSTEKKAQTVDQMEKALIEKMLAEYGNKDEVARVLGIGRATLYRKLKKYGM